MVRHAATVLASAATVLATVLVAIALGAGAAHAQGIPDPRTGVAYPTAQGAAVEDATALMVNPAGLANLEGVEVNMGGFLRTHLDTGQSDADATVAFSPGDGLGLGFGTGITLRNGVSPLWRTSAGVGVGGRS